MPAQWEDKFVKCPFYKKTNANTIVCEGVCGASATHLTFASKADKKEYMKGRCFDIHDAKKCPIHAAVESKYPDE